jgi:hypothetical protein
MNKDLFAQVMAGDTVQLHDALYPITRHGALEDAWFDLTYVPIREPDGSVGGILATVVEKTASVLAGRRLLTLHHVSNQAAGAKTRKPRSTGRRGALPTVSRTSRLRSATCSM